MDRICLTFLEIMEEITEKYEEVKRSFKETPFKIVQIKERLLIGDIDRINQLSDNGRLVLKHISKYINVFLVNTKLDVKEITEEEFGMYTETLATRVRRGIRNLVKNNVIAYSTRKNEYWLNKGVIWK